MQSGNIPMDFSWPEFVLVKVETKEELSLIDVAPGLDTQQTIGDEHVQHVYDEAESIDSPRPEFAFAGVDTKEELSLIDTAPGLETQQTVEGGHMQHVYDEAESTFETSSSKMIAEVNDLTYHATVYHVDDGYFYRKHDSTINRMRLRCVTRTLCPGRVSMPLEPSLRKAHALKHLHGHDHLPQPSWIKVALLKKAILQRCSVEGTALRTIYDEEIARVDLHVSAEVPYHTFSQTMYRARRDSQVPIPGSLQEVFSWPEFVLVKVETKEELSLIDVAPGLDSQQTIGDEHVQHVYDEAESIDSPRPEFAFVGVDTKEELSLIDTVPGLENQQTVEGGHMQHVYDEAESTDYFRPEASSVKCEANEKISTIVVEPDFNTDVFIKKEEEELQFGDSGFFADSPRPEFAFVGVDTKEELSLIDTVPGLETQQTVEGGHVQHIYDEAESTFETSSSKMITEVNDLSHNATVYHVDDGYFYRKHDSTMQRMQLKCATRTLCPGRASMPLEPSLRKAHALKLNRGHDHLPQPSWIKVALLKKAILQRCSVEGTALRTIYDEEIARVDLHVSAEVPYHTFCHSMYRARRDLQVPIPGSLQEYGADLEANERYGHTIVGARFYRATLVDDEGDTAVVFVSPTIENRLSTEECTHAHADGTFKTTPAQPQCSYFLTLSVIYFDRAFPLVSALITRKTEMMYNLLFNFIVHLFPDWVPSVVTTDYEVALQNTLRRAWPAAQIVGCWFHSANCMIKKAHKLGHTIFLEENADARKTVKMCQVLSLLPAHLIGDGYDAVVAFAEQRGVLLTLVRFLNYVYRVWITGVGAQSLSVYRQRRRTSNDMEYYHQKLWDIMAKPNPNIWVFTDGVRALEHKAASTLMSLERMKLNLRPTRLSYLLSNGVIQQLTTQLDAQQCTVGEFLEVASTQIETVHNKLYNQAVNEDSEDEDVDGLVQAWLPPENEVPAAVARRRVRRKAKRRGAGAAARGRGGPRGGRGGRGRGGQPTQAGHGPLLAAPPVAEPNPVDPPPVLDEPAGPVVAPPPAGPVVAPPLAGPVVAPPLAGPVVAPPLAGPVVAPPLAGPTVAAAPTGAGVVYPPNVPVLNPCLICLEHRWDMMVAISCGHITVCEECSAKLVDRQRCMVCRQSITSLTRIRLMH